MNRVLLSYAALGLAIVCEVAGSTCLQKSEQFTRLHWTAAMLVFYLASLYLLSEALKAIPLGIAYAIWAGLGIVLTALVSVTLLRQPLDMPALLGIAMIVGGVVVINLFSRVAIH